jgi:hypothetical protein
VWLKVGNLTGAGNISARGGGSLHKDPAQGDKYINSCYPNAQPNAQNVPCVGGGGGGGVVAIDRNTNVSFAAKDWGGGGCAAHFPLYDVGSGVGLNCTGTNGGAYNGGACTNTVNGSVVGRMGHSHCDAGAFMPLPTWRSIDASSIALEHPGGVDEAMQYCEFNYTEPGLDVSVARAVRSAVCIACPPGKYKHVVDPHSSSPHVVDPLTATEAMLTAPRTADAFGMQWGGGQYLNQCVECPPGKYTDRYVNDDGRPNTKCKLCAKTQKTNSVYSYQPLGGQVGEQSVNSPPAYI